MEIDKKFKLELKLLKDPKVKKKLKSLIIQKHKLMEQKELEEQKRIDKHNKYLPKYLSVDILNAVGFIEYSKRKGPVDMKGMVKFLETEKKFSQKEIGWVLLLLSIEAIEEILGTPEIGEKIQEALLKNKRTLH
jgi:hypothetical protein